MIDGSASLSVLKNESWEKQREFINVKVVKNTQLVANGGLKIPLGTAKSYPLACGQPARLHPYIQNSHQLAELALHRPPFPSHKQTFLQ
jgi:hypothetical protein